MPVQTFTHGAPSTDCITKIDSSVAILPTAVSLACVKSNACSLDTGESVERRNCALGTAELAIKQ